MSEGFVFSLGDDLGIAYLEFARTHRALLQGHSMKVTLELLDTATLTTGVTRNPSLHYTSCMYGVKFLDRCSSRVVHVSSVRVLVPEQPVRGSLSS